MISAFIWNEHYALHQYIWYNRNTLPQIHWNNLSCSFLPDGHFLCNMIMLESSFEPGRLDSVFFTPDLFTFIKMNNVCCVLWNSQKNNKTSLRYVLFRFEHPFSCKISQQWTNLIKWICVEWDTLSAANFIWLFYGWLRLWTQWLDEIFMDLYAMLWKQYLCKIKSNLLFQK